MLRLISRLVGLLPLSWVDGIGRLLGWLAFSVLRVRRRVALENLQRALGLSRARCVRLAAGVYRHLGRGAFGRSRNM